MSRGHVAERPVRIRMDPIAKEFIPSIPAVDIYAALIPSIPAVDIYAALIPSIPPVDTYAALLR